MRLHPTVITLVIPLLPSLVSLSHSCNLGIEYYHLLIIPRGGPGWLVSPSSSSFPKLAWFWGEIHHK